jgi:hypothetical protein
MSHALERARALVPAAPGHTPASIHSLFEAMSGNRRCLVYESAVQAETGRARPSDDAKGGPGGDNDTSRWLARGMGLPIAAP